jgi:hypothetical protein
MPTVKDFSVAAVAGMLGIAGSASGQEIVVNFGSPSLDRWMYPFNFTPGLETRASCFGAIEQAGFDDRDGEFLLGFNVGAQVPAGLPLDQYRIVSARLTAVVLNDLEARYDPTFDTVRSLYQTSHPDYQPDADPGRPVEVYACGYRNGWTLQTFGEQSPFGGAPIVPPAEGATIDVSRQVRQRFDAPGLSIGTTDSVNPGELIPAGTVMTFEFSPCDPGTRLYLRQALAAGRLNLLITSLQPASGGPDGGSGDRTYPQFYTKENAAGLPATLQLVVRVGDPGDFNGDGFKDFFDYADFIDAFESGEPEADFNQDCFVDFFDFDDFVGAFER